MTDEATADRVERLLDAIDLIKHNDIQPARALLRSIIQEDSNFEDAWLWMSVVVDALDQSIVCLDNVLRINPNNWQAAGALHRLRESELLMQKRRSRLRFYRDLSYFGMMILVFFWLLSFILA
jgi:hypothetical protein